MRPALGPPAGGDRPTTSATATRSARSSTSARRRLPVSPPESVAVRSSSRYDGYSWSGAPNEPLATPVNVCTRCVWQVDGRPPVDLLPRRPTDVADPEFRRPGAEREAERVAQAGGDDPARVRVGTRRRGRSGGRRSSGSGTAGTSRSAAPAPRWPCCPRWSGAGCCVVLPHLDRARPRGHHASVAAAAVATSRGYVARAL
jgi:hypothetical protein